MSSVSLRGSNKSSEKERSKLEKLKEALFLILSQVGLHLGLVEP